MLDVRCRDLRTDHLVDPVGLAVGTPRFSWTIDSGVPGAVQAAYEIEVHQVAPGPARPVWATGKVSGGRSVPVDHAGPALSSSTAYTWRVRVWLDGQDQPSDWCGATFETGPAADDWVARWVRPTQEPTATERWSLMDWIRGRGPDTPPAERMRPVRLVRQAFHLDRPVHRARLHASAHGTYVAQVNGSAVGDEVLAPGLDSYAHAVSVQTYDVGALLTSGENVVGVMLADGWWAGRIGLSGSSAQWGDRTSVIWQLHVDHDDGSTSVVASDATARWTPGPMRYADLFVGEHLDRRAVIEKWSEPGFDHSGWRAVETSAEGRSVLVSCADEPVRRLMALPPVAVGGNADDGFVVDFGQVVAGRVRLTLREAAPGQTVTIEHTEVLAADGTWFVNIAGVNKDQTNVYVAAGLPGGETYEPTFSFQGFRYARIRGLRSAPAVADVRAVVLGSDLDVTGHFSTSDRRLNRLHENVVWSQRGNFLSVPTDCPQRERAGWTADIQVFAPAATHNMRVITFLGRWLRNLRADQLPDGRIPVISPWSPFDAQATGAGDGIWSIVSAAGWSDAVAIVPWVLYERYGDRRVLEENYEAMCRWARYQRATAAAEVPSALQGVELDGRRRAAQALLWNTGHHFGDWLTPSTLRGGPLHETIGVAPRLTSEIIAPMFQANTLTLLARSAEVLGRSEDAADHRARAAAVRAAFTAEYVGDDGRLTCDMQGPYVLALAFDMVPSALRPRLAERLAALVEGNDDRLDTGFLSTPYLLDVLWDNGYRDTARRVLWQAAPPSWLYQVDHGATTTWEAWDAIASDGTPREVSLNHYAFGCIDDWLYRRIAGISLVTPGYATFRVEPDLDAGVDHVDAGITTPHGNVRVTWHRTGDEVEVRVAVPVGTTAELVLGDTVEVIGAGTTVRHLRATGRSFRPPAAAAVLQ